MRACEEMRLGGRGHQGGPAARQGRGTGGSSQMRKMPGDSRCRVPTLSCRKNALLWNDLSTHLRYPGVAAGGQLRRWISLLFADRPEGAGIIMIRRELPRTSGREFGRSLIA